MKLLNNLIVPAFCGLLIFSGSRTTRKIRVHNHLRPIPNLLHIWEDMLILTEY